MLAEAVDAGSEVRQVFALVDDTASAELAARASAELIPVERQALERIAGTESPRGPVAVIPIPAPGRCRRDAIVVGVADPGNAGTLVRTAAAFGLDIVAADGVVDLWSPKVLRAGAGAHFRTTVATELPPGMGLVATVVAGGSDPAGLDLDPGRQWGVVVGNETRGLGRDVIAAADVRVTIPMPGGVESLNAAIAGAIVAYELARWRRSVHPAPG